MKILRKLITIILIANLCIARVSSIDPLSGLVGLIGAIGLSAIYSTWDYLKCSSNECCHKANEEKGFYKEENSFQFHRKAWIDYSLSQLENSLNNKLHGQHLVKNIVPKLIRKHLNNEKPVKALVISFHGWTGGGKNFVSEIVAKSIFRKYKESLKSDFVHKIITTQHFSGDNVTVMRSKIKQFVTNGVKVCERSLFIFDEIDKMPTGLIDAIKPFIDFHPDVDGIDYRKAIFLFLSNSGGTGISQKTYDFYLEGKERTDITMKDMEPLMNSGAYNEIGGLRKSDVIEKNLIDAFVPFLPLEKKHIESCIKDYLKEHYNKSNPLQDPGIEFINKVSNELEYFPPDTQRYSKTGCKRVAHKVETLID